MMNFSIKDGDLKFLMRKNQGNLPVGLKYSLHHFLNSTSIYSDNVSYGAFATEWIRKKMDDYFYIRLLIFQVIVLPCLYIN